MDRRSVERMNDPSDSEPRPAYWFPAKRYGWGWSLPCTWQGWLVLAGFLVAVAVAEVAAGDALPVVLVALVVALFVVLRAKGEPPRWRWGGKD